MAMTDSADTETVAVAKALEDPRVVTDVRTIPNPLRSLDEWVVMGASGEMAKRPVEPNTGWNEGDVLSFEEACKEATVKTNPEEMALGFRVHGRHEIVAIDLDDTPTLEEAEELLNALGPGYLEWSQSGEGLHLFRPGEPHETVKGASIRGSQDGTLELYWEGQPIMLTGDVVTDTLIDGRGLDTNRARAPVKEVLGGELVDYPDDLSTESQASGPETGSKTNTAELDEEAGTLIRAARKGNQSKPGETDPRSVDHSSPDAMMKSVAVSQVVQKATECDSDFEPLWEGDPSGYASVSEADMALTCKLVFWCRGYKPLVQECFRQSGLYGVRGNGSAKWDSHQISGQSYGEYTVESALDVQTDVYSGEYSNNPTA